MSEVCQVKTDLLGKLQTKSLTRLKKNCKIHAIGGSQILWKSKKQFTLKVWYLVIKCLREALFFFLSLDYFGTGLSSSSESKEEESREYNEPV